ncbi:MAG: hypothetical protein AMJ43_01185 [Coxiella sp. DG_40]|nr:MAG: hypothetical protein AMJ43_01185 [Coxiella sp. DG_40]
MDKLNKISLVLGILAVATLPSAIQANGVTNSRTDNQIITLGNQQVAVDQVPKPPQMIEKSVFDGFYLGIGPNLTVLTGKGMWNTTKVPSHPHLSGEDSWPLSDYNIGISGFAGIGKVFNQKVYAGGELFANYSPLRTRGYNSHVTYSDPTKEPKHGYSADVKSYYNLGGALRIGYLLSQRAMIYALIGGDYTQFKFISHDGNKPGGIYAVTPKRTKNVVTFMPGVGIESMLNKNWALRAQYTYSPYLEFKDAFTGTIHKDGPPTDVKVKYNLARNIFSVAAIYHFNSPDTQNLPTSPYYMLEQSLLNGLYIGAGPEFIATIGKMIIDTETSGFRDKVPLRISSYYPGVGILGGYGSSYKQWYVGNELFANYSPVRSKLHTIIGDNHIDVYKIRSDFSYGAAVRGGYMFSPKLLAYLILGVDFSRFEANSKQGYNPKGNYVSGPKKGNTLVGFMPGFGIESLLYKNLSIRAQYTYSLYTTNIRISYTVNNKHISEEYNPVRSTFGLFLSYHFM